MNKRLGFVAIITLIAGAIWYLTSNDFHGSRIIDLPEDGHLWHTTIVTDNSSSSIAFMKMMNENPRLQSLLDQTQSHYFTPEDRLYKAHYHKYFGDNLPAILVQRPANKDGTSRACYKVSGRNIPANADRLADEIQTSVGDCQPKPDKQPGIPDLRPKRPNNHSSTPPWMWLLPFIGSGLGIYKIRENI